MLHWQTSTPLGHIVVATLPSKKRRQSIEVERPEVAKGGRGQLAASPTPCTTTTATLPEVFLIRRLIFDVQKKSSVLETMVDPCKDHSRRCQFNILNPLDH
jgi:hypothetical protein